LIFQNATKLCIQRNLRLSIIEGLISKVVKSTFSKIEIIVHLGS